MPGFLHVETNAAEVAQQYQGLAEGIETAMQEFIVTSSAGLEESLRSVAPVNHDPMTGMGVGGRLKQSLVMQTGTLGAELYGVGYGAMVIAGTPPHVITPQGRDALAFFWERIGGRVMFRRVQHPGAHPNDFRAAGIQLWVDTGQMSDAITQFWQALGALLE